MLMGVSLLPSRVLSGGGASAESELSIDPRIGLQGIDLLAKLCR